MTRNMIKPLLKSAKGNDATIECLPQTCIVESDNCSCQYKSAKHFEDLQEICDGIGIPLVRLFSMAGHSKGKVDHVGGIYPTIDESDSI